MSDSALRILYVITDLKLGGVPLHLYRLALDMRSRGDRPIVVSLAPPARVGQMLQAEGVETRDCGGRGRWDIRVIARLARLIRRVEPDIIHSFLFHGNLAARLAAGPARFPAERVLCEIQTVEVERRWHLWVDRWTHRHCRCIIGNSPSVVEHLATAGRIPPERLRLVRGGIDPDRLRPPAPADRIALGLPADGPLVLWVGRLDPIKGVHCLVDAFRTIASRTLAHLVLAGDGPARLSLLRQIESANLIGSAHLLGAREDVPALMYAADLFAFPSRTEGLPNALLEAMAAARPIVTTDAPGCRDLISHERTGLLVPYGDTHALAAAILRLLTDRALAASLGTRAAKEVTTSWHIRDTYAAYAALYRQTRAR